MAVRLKFANDLNIFGGSRGAGGFLSTPVLIGGGYPAYGTVLTTTYGVDYEIGFEIYSAYLAIFVKTQTCDVDTLADGVGGSFVDWGGASNIQYKPYETHIADGPAVGLYPVEVPEGSGDYHNSALSDDSEEIHDGTGAAIIIPIGFGGYFNNGTLIYGHSVNLAAEVPYGSSHYEDNGLSSNYEYRWNGAGGYNDVFIDTIGSYNTAWTEINSALRYDSGNQHMADVPSTSGNLYPDGKTYEYTYYWDGSGGYDYDVTGNLTGSYYPFHTFISDHDCPEVGVSGVGLGYYWDGDGGYFIDTYT